MYLKSLSLKGFKSFADKTQMSFDPGLNVVVGPNGSGKSNVSDAVLWVLGEQSARMLRGQAMEDVIFSGSSAREPVGVAEVTLVLDNEDHTLPIDFSEVALTRRMYRSGESEYLVNGAPSRLRDIQDILHDSGLGKDTHSIISQGKLDSILSGRPEERRELIEEAAGISKHRRRKERAERKLTAMDANLVRAKDVQRELNRQLRPLERQVDQARRHHDLKAQLQGIRTSLAVDDLRQLQLRHRELSSAGNEAAARVELAQYRLDERNHELEKYQSLLEQKGIFVGDLDGQRRRMQDLLGRMDSDIRLLEEKGKNMVARLSEMRMSLSTAETQRADAEHLLSAVSSELAEARGAETELRSSVKELKQSSEEATAHRRELGAQVNKLNNEQRQAQHVSDTETLAYARLRDQIESAETTDELYEQRLSRISEQLTQNEAATEKAEARKKQLETSLAQAHADQDIAEQHIAECREAVSLAREHEVSARKALSAAEADLAATEALDRAGENQSDLVAALARGPQKDLIRYRLADVMEPAPEYEAAFEAFFGGDLAALVVDSVKEAGLLAQTALEMNSKGTATLLSLESASLAHEDADNLPGVALAGKVVAQAGCEALVACLLDGVRYVESAEQALQAHEMYPGLSFVSADGAVVHGDGRTSVGKLASVSAGALERKRRLRTLRASMPQLQANLETAITSLADAEAALATARDESSAARGELARMKGELSSTTSELGRLAAQHDSALSEKKQVERTRQAAADKVAEAREQVQRHKQAANEAQARAKEIAAQLEDINAERSRASREEREAQDRYSETKLRLATTSERRNHLESRERELLRSVKQLTERLETTRLAAASLDVVRLRVEPLHERYDAVRGCAFRWAERLRDRASLEEASSDSLKKTIAEARAVADAAAKELDAAKAEEASVKIEIGKVQVEVKHAVEAIAATGMPLEEALELPAPDNREESERRAERIAHQLESLGPVNEAAMDQYSKLKERADYIASQVEDLERARTSLRKITLAIERKMRKRFLTVFDQVNVNFSEVFSLLFPGGKAHLEMDDPDHPDETGIEISAQPRGKRIAKMTLMSGGEKSLTALALLFAVYKTRTVPFYIFDEVEAALDDANLTKLLDAIERLKETTQLIVISHQRRTMEQADVLYGVSMRADGVSRVVSQRLDRATGKVVDA
ncbi:chromosome segregation protein SMC [Atopobium sp. oral taxon 810]|uniref:chromosome segregation protein SMC n=1 Tax=Atopobium sp. oral taxon 810 TaxID=712158 RepID=UPI000397AD27|nr:chromosome segregation protein SMC [Atopobium sp. oral taxon 810]ERI04058.1 segregation protein SMC [Atopobium sp. oral taxon 810 str. F0209]